MANENYVLLQNITPAQSTMMTCLSIEALGVILDCKGHTIFGNDYYANGMNSPYVINTTFNNLIIKNCDIRASAKGIILSGNNFVVKNSTVYGGKDYDSANNYYDRYGSGIDIYNYGTIENSTIYANGAYAIYVAGGTLVPTIISNNTIIGPIHNSYNGGGGALSIFNNELTVGGSGLNPDTDQYAGITAITLGGARSTNISNNLFSGSGNYGIFLKRGPEGSGVHTISNNTFDLGTAIGIYGDTGEHRIFNNTIRVGNSVGVQLQQGSYIENNMIITTGIDGSANYGIYFNNPGSIQLNNSMIITAGANHTYIAGIGNYEYVFLNVSFNGSLVGFDPMSTNRLIVKWYLNTTTLNSSGIPLSGMTVTAKQQNGTEVVSVVTDQSGRAQLALVEYEQNATALNNWNPYTLTVHDASGSYIDTSVSLNLLSSIEYNLTLSKSLVSALTIVPSSPVEISNTATIQLNYTYASNSSPVTGASVNLIIFDTTPSRTILAGGLAPTYVPSSGLWQYNYTTPAGTNGTYKYNIKGSVPGLLGSDFDVNGTFDTKDATPPQISGVTIATSCSGHSNYRLANAPFDATFSATDNWEVNRTFSLCNLTLSNSTSMTVSVVNDSNKCSFPTSGPVGSASAKILINDTANNTATSLLEVTVVDSCPVSQTPSSSQSSSGGGSGGGGGGGGGSIIVSTSIISEGLPEMLFETRSLSVIEGQPEKFKITLKNPKKEPLTVTLEGPPEVSFAEKGFTVSAGGEKEVYVTLSYSSAGDYKPFISAQLGDLKKVYDISVKVAKSERGAIEQLLMDVQKAVNSLLSFKGKACGGDVELIESKTLAIETLAQEVRRSALSGGNPPDAKVAELRRELAAASDFMDKTEECKPTVIKQDSTPDKIARTKSGGAFPAIPLLAALFGSGLFFRFLKGRRLGGATGK